MAARLVLLFSFTTLVSAPVDETKIPAEPGENATLPCRTPNHRPAIIVEWRRNDTGEVKPVALYRDGRLESDGQHPAYKDRVDILDREMKDGDVSLVLKNVTTNDTGTYEFRVVQREILRRKRAEMEGDPICIINLDVAPPPPSGDKGGLQEDGGNKDRGNKDGGNKDGGNEDGGSSAGLIAGIIVGFIVVLALVGGFLLYRKHRQSVREQNPPARETERDPMNIESGL